MTAATESVDRDLPSWRGQRVRTGMRRSNRGPSYKFMVSVNMSVVAELRKVADEFGLSIQEQIRVILGQWKTERDRLKANGKI